MNVPTRKKDTQKSVEIMDLIPRPVMLPDEDPMTFEALREALIIEFSPGTPYEMTLVENLIALEWEAIRHRRMRDDLIRSSYRNIAIQAYEGDDIRRRKHGYIRPGPAVDSARDLVGADAQARKNAEEKLIESGYEPSEILAVAFTHELGAIDAHERRLADIEMRRRRLREDIDRLQHVRKRRFEDAEVIEA